MESKRHGERDLWGERDMWRERCAKEGCMARRARRERDSQSKKGTE